MNILVISDLHLGNNDRLDTFGWKPDAFIRALECLQETYQISKIVLNGDVFELYKYRFEEAQACHAQLINYLLKKQSVFIKGNHDALSPMGQDSYVFENQEGKTIYIEHGHSVDFMNGSRIGRTIHRVFFNFLKYLAQQNWVLNLYFDIVEKTEQVNHIPKKYDSYKYLKYALKLLKTYDMVVLGHTHKIEAHKTYYLNSKKRYVNSGSCSLGRFQGLVINTETLEFETIKIKDVSEFFLRYGKSLYQRMVLTA